MPTPRHWQRGRPPCCRDCGWWTRSCPPAPGGTCCCGWAPADPTSLLGSAAVAAALADQGERLVDDDLTEDDDDLADLILNLLAAGGRTEPGGLAGLVLTDDSGEPWPAAELLLPHSVLRPLIDTEDLPSVDPRLVSTWGTDTLQRAGVRDRPQLIATDDPRADELLPSLDEWIDLGQRGAEVLAVTDLDLIDPDRWPEFLAVLAADPDSRAAVLADGYTRWWLRREVRVAGRPLTDYRLPTAGELDNLCDPLPTGIDHDLAVALGVRTRWAEVVAGDPLDALGRFTDPDRTLAASQVPTLSAVLADGLDGLDGLEGDADLPDVMRTLAGTVAPADQVVVPDGPWWSQLLDPGQLAAPGMDPARTADVFGLDLASDLFRARVVAGDRLVKPAAAHHFRDQVALAAAALSVPVDLASLEHRPGLAVRVDPALRRAGSGGTAVGWWPASSTGFAVDGSDLAIAQALAWLAGRWSDRHRVLAELTGTGPRATIDAAFDPTD